MHIGTNGLALIKSFEGCKLEAYEDVRGIWSIGYGHIAGVSQGSCITESEATIYLQQDVGWAERVIDLQVSIALTQNQFDALVSFVYNVGSGNFATSTLLRHLNDNAINEAANEFVKWDKADGQVVPGLLRRRQAERDLFLS
jgi:lysozyme